MSGTPSEQSQLYNSCVVHRGGDAGARLRPARSNLLKCNLLRPPGLIDEQSAEEPGAGDDSRTRPALPPIAPKIAPALAPAASNPFRYVVVGRR
jgi:hypothetical protein